MSELSIVGAEPVVKLIKQIYPYLKAKKAVAKLVLEIVDQLSHVKNEVDFIEVCKLVDKVADLTDSKGRKNTSDLVKSKLLSTSYLNKDTCRDL